MKGQLETGSIRERRGKKRKLNRKELTDQPRRPCLVENHGGNEMGWEGWGWMEDGKDRRQGQLGWKWQRMNKGHEKGQSARSQ